MNQLSQVSVFPLGQTVIFPHTSLPLYIFEPRYLKMVHDAMTLHQPIAITPHREDDDYEDVVCGFGHPHILNQREDGTLDIVLFCTGKGILCEKQGDRPYKSYSIDWIKENEGDISEDSAFALSRIEMKSRNWLKLNMQAAVERAKVIKLLSQPLTLVHYAALFLIRDGSVKQKILDIDDLEGKIKLVDRYFSQADKIEIGIKLS